MWNSDTINFDKVYQVYLGNVEINKVNKINESYISIVDKL